jgi:hypothetical protein
MESVINGNTEVINFLYESLIILFQFYAYVIWFFFILLGQFQLFMLNCFFFQVFLIWSKFFSLILVAFDYSS